MVTAHIRPTRHTYQEMHPDGKLTSYVYDNGGRQTGRRYPDGARVTLAYDAVGNRTLAQDTLGRYTATFDSLNRTRTATTPAGKTITYAYDAGSQRRYMIDPDGGRCTYAFDAVGRNSLVVNPQAERTTWTFDVGGRTTVQQLANGCRASYAYDQGNRLVRLANLKSDGTTLSSFRDAWDNAGNRTSRVEADGVRVTWNYDNTYQLTREQRSGGNAYDIAYTYDNASNRRTKLENSIRTTYAYDSANQLATLQDNTGTTTFTFDNAGNQQLELTPAGGRTTNTWDYENRLTKVQLPSAVVNTFAYNPDNLRVKTQDSTGTLKQIWDGQKVLLETDNSNVTQATYSLSAGYYGDLFSQRRSGATSFYLFDPLGSTDRLVNVTQVESDRYIYQAFGVPALASGSTNNRFRFVGASGYEHSSDLTRYYVRARWLHAAMGRFLAIDQLPRDKSVNFYRYAANRPLVFVDPSGMQVTTNLICPEYMWQETVLPGHPHEGRELRFKSGWWIFAHDVTCEQEYEWERVGPEVVGDCNKALDATILYSWSEAVSIGGQVGIVVNPPKIEWFEVVITGGREVIIGTSGGLSVEVHAEAIPCTRPNIYFVQRVLRCWRWHPSVPGTWQGMPGGGFSAPGPAYWSLALKVVDAVKGVVCREWCEPCDCEEWFYWALGHPEWPDQSYHPDK